MRQPVRVVLADDHDAFVEGLGMVLSAEDDLEIVALAGDGASTLQAVRTHHPDVLVVDTEMPGPAVAELVRLVGQADPAPPHPARPAGHAAPQPRDGGAPEREGNRPPGGVPGAVHSPGRPERDLHAELLLRSLSDRERQVLDLLARGYSNRRIAEACYLSLNTVRTHVQNVLVKLGVHSKLEAAALAVRQGLVRIEDHPV